MAAPRDMGEKKEVPFQDCTKVLGDPKLLLCNPGSDFFTCIYHASISTHEAVQSTAAVCDCEELLLFVAGTSVDSAASAAPTANMSVYLTHFATSTYF